MVVKTRESTHGQFKEIGKTGIFVSEEGRGFFKDLVELSKKNSELLKKNGLRPMTYLEGLTAAKNPEFREKLKDTGFVLQINGTGFVSLEAYQLTQDGKLVRIDYIRSTTIIPVGIKSDSGG